MALQFHLDENVDPSVANGLHRRDMAVTTTNEVGLQGASDEQQLIYAISRGRVLYTQDSDFLIISARSFEHTGVAYNAPSACSVGQIIDYVTLMDACLTPHNMRNHIEWVKP